MAKKTEIADLLPKKSAAEIAGERLDLIQQILKTKPAAASDSVEQKLRLLYELQVIDSEIDNIRTLRGELPVEVQNLEDEIAGLETRIENIQTEIKKQEASIAQRKIDIETSKDLMRKYEEQQNNVRNNREFESLSKEIEFQGLEMELAEKKIREAQALIKDRKVVAEEATVLLEDRKTDLVVKQKELDGIVVATEKEEKQLMAKSEEYQAAIEPRLISAYHRLRKNARNGLAVVEVRRDACGGCFNKIPPQRQADIKIGKRVIACEYCGRILVDWELPSIVL